jgi:hypothetical protein
VVVALVSLGVAALAVVALLVLMIASQLTTR